MRWLSPILGFLLFFGTAPAALAASFAFAGNYTLTDNDQIPDGFSETLTFDNPLGPHSGLVGAFDPIGDGIFGDAGFETVEIAVLTLDPSSPFDFSPTLYIDGFRVYDDNGSLLMEADLTADSLVISGGTGDINPAFLLNLTNIVGGPSYTAGTSDIVDAFLTAPAGAANVTLQLPGGDLAAAILNGDTISSTYSASAAAEPAGDPVPEPTTATLFALGLAGLTYVGRRR